MTEKKTKIPTKLVDMIQLVDKSEAEKVLGEAFASFLNNPTVTWAKFILTDDRMNGNGMRVPKSEFPNIINTGVHMPVKMALGEISPTHDDSKPLGVITHLTEFELEDGVSAIVALAALWGEERPADVAFLKERFAQRQPVDISWEILYKDEVFNEELGSIDLLSTALRAATVVGNPAYQGRTPFLAISAKTQTKEEASSEENTEENEVEKELQEKLDAALARVSELEAQLGEKDTAIAELTTQKTKLEEEITPLKEFKEQADAAVAKAEKLSSIKQKFEEAGLQKDDEYYTTNEETLLKLEESQLDFMVAELKAFASAKADEDKKEETSSTKNKKTKIPALRGENGENTSVKDLAKALRERNGK